MKKVLILFLIMASLLLTGCDDTDRTVSISLPSGTYYGEQHVTLTCADPSAQIFYTLDGSDPGESTLIYNSETGIDINYTSDLKASAGGDVASAHYDIIPYGEMTAEQRAFYDKIAGNWTIDENLNDNLLINSSTLTIQNPGAPEIKSGYYIKDINGNNANIVYTDNDGKNIEVPVQADPENYHLNFNNRDYVAQWMYGG